MNNTHLDAHFDILGCSEAVFYTFGETYIFETFSKPVRGQAEDEEKGEARSMPSSF